MYSFIILIFLSLASKFKHVSTATSSTYKKLTLNNIDTSSASQSQYLIIKFNTFDKIKCLSKCNSLSECSISLYSIQTTECVLANVNAYKYLYQSSQNKFSVYLKTQSLSIGLIHYWSFNGNVYDSVGGANLYGGLNAALTSDRFNKPQSALGLYNGFYTLPNGVYFNSNYSVTLWVKARSFNANSRIIDVGNGEYNSNVIIHLTKGVSGCLQQEFYVGNSYESNSETSKPLTLNKWQHVAFTQSNSKGSIYIDGVLETSAFYAASNKNPSGEIRSLNHIGKSSWASDGLADADFDEIKIYNRELSYQEVLNDLFESFN